MSLAGGLYTFEKLVQVALRRTREAGSRVKEKAKPDLWRLPAVACGGLCLQLGGG